MFESTDVYECPSVRLFAIFTVYANWQQTSESEVRQDQTPVGRGGYMSHIELRLIAIYLRNLAAHITLLSKTSVVTGLELQSNMQLMQSTSTKSTGLIFPRYHAAG